MQHCGFRFGDWQVEVAGNSLRMGDTRVSLEPRAMDVLRYLCRHPHAVIPPEELLEKCWGTPELGDNPVHKAIAQLRKALGDSSTDPRYIETVRKRGYRAIAEVVEEDEAAGGWDQGSPFRGLAAFEESHAAIFFGRVQAATRLRQTVLDQVSGGCAMALVLGASGSGKTSLVRAGLLPQLMVTNGGLIALDCTLHMDCADLGGSGLLGALAAVLLDAESDGALLFDGLDAASLGQRLRDEPAAVAAHLAPNGPARLAVFVDRLEAVFRAADSAADRAAFFHVLERLARANVLVVLACRNDFYPDLMAVPEMMALKTRGGHFDVEPPDGAAIAQMVREPARAARLTFERDADSGASLDDVLCDAARASPDALPLLQYCLDELYRQRGDDGLLRFDVFRQLGGIEGALGVRAEQVVAALPADQQAALPRILSLLVCIGEEQHAITARRAPWSALRDDAERDLVRALVDARLFVSELAGDVPGFGVAHEALLRRWPRIANWIEVHRQTLQIRTRITAQAARWAADGRPRDLLLPPGIQANQARAVQASADISLSAQESEFVAASLRRVKLGERVRVAIVAVIALLALLAGVLGLTARAAQQDAERRRADAEGLLGFMLGDFADKLRPLGRLELLDDVSKRALAYLAGGKDDGDPRTAVQRAKALQVIAEVDIARAKPDSAQTALLAARGILAKQLERVPDDRAALKAQGAVAFWLSQVHRNRDDWPGALNHLVQYRDLSRKLVALAPDDADSMLELSYALNGIGTIRIGMRDFIAASAAFEESIRLKRAVIKRKQNDAALMMSLANSYSWLAKANAARGALASAKALYETERQLIHPVLEGNRSNAEWGIRLASAVAHIAEMEQALGDPTSQERWWEALRIMAVFIKTDPSNLAWQRELHVIGTKSAYLASYAAPAKALAELESLRDGIARLNAADPSLAELSRLSVQLDIYIASTLVRMKEISRAAVALNPALSKLRSVAATGGKDMSLRLQLADALLIHALILKGQQQDDKAASACQEAASMLVPMRQREVEYYILATLVQAHDCMGEGAAVRVERQRLLDMKFRDPAYLHHISLHPPQQE
ncbi:nSTAND1 domain-containing NTPase [Pseudoduganella umbonata]|uniref:DNA-binding winged helix-turn-helix (WHTH) protein/tetratricopeptide (TPR) repeat protein n=1 Tax=Pseudoduganella umbonata TaxID=864828 RepID=A0A4P8HQB8_9BURK|nr:winged helix-turn-helix domain-containing protein [Pseudoduganella umbonata]MBB3221373.1 DNA-binding winged helix-turn-helix (wHTH) protein/tetratricopeptide (TPR) repeat protein [Pseudoduganella umbonata]QCP10535.1 transcriptional regulator [Pseudoduganella umbonata]